ncbi:YolD-like family protein [Oceanobacillus jeddahense]|uniref:YolD-like family protein n=1 Tax=Oceanobacillus jeddahense TaxID=1462527 RepID=UPI00059613C0|nr:YolD-like family protein [Oceanobacillus jeddahense]
MQKPVLDLDQLELNGIRIYDAYKEGKAVWIKYFNEGTFKEIVCHIDEPIDIWDMVIKCSNDGGVVDIPFNWIVQVDTL